MKRTVKKIVILIYLVLLGTKKYKDKYKDTNIIIYSMGKVGSKSIKNSIENCIHLHSLEGLNNKYFLNNYTERLKIIDFALEKLRWRLTQQVIKQKIKDGTKLKVITLVRDPIARNVSSFFQPSKVRNESYTTDYFYLFLNHYTPLYWFQQEIQRHLGIDVYEHTFDQEKGYTFINQDNVELLILKMEELSNNIDAIGEFVHDKNFTMSNQNVGSEKWYANQYKNFKEEFKPSKAYMDLLYDSKYTNHFYSSQEIEEFKKKWSEK